MTPTTINTISGELLIVEVPEDAYGFILNKSIHLNYLIKGFPHYLNKDLSDNCELLGTIQYSGGKYIFDWDCEKYVGYYEDEKRYEEYCNKYTSPGSEFCLDTKEDSFISLLESNGIHFVNPVGSKPIRKVPFLHDGYYTDRDKSQVEEYQKNLSEWQSIENNLIKGKLVVLKKGN